ncbi:MAG: ABC transporter permease [Chloroflexi bacterium]|nr:MAG: ABC transporter permease [Chloroflexota bacterium]
MASSVDRAAGSGVERTLAVVGRLREFGILVALAGVVVAVSLLTPRFLSLDNLGEVLLSISLIAIAATGQTVVVLTRNVDLSVGSMVGLVAFVTGDLLKQHALGVPEAVLAGCAAGLALGAVNGLVVTAGRVPAIVATLGTLNVYRGLVFFIAGGTEVSAIDLPPGYLGIATARVVGIPVLILCAAAVAGVVAYWLRSSRTGRSIYAIGSNPAAAEAIGIPSQRLVFAAFAVSGLLCGVAGVLWGARFGTVNAFAASGLELQVIAAVVVGGVNIFGGSGSVLGAMLGAILLGTIDNSLTLLHLSQFWLQAIDGAVILLAVGADAAIRGYVQRALRAQGRR